MKQKKKRDTGVQELEDFLKAVLSGIFSDAETALSDSEKDAQNKLRFIRAQE